MALFRNKTVTSSIPKTGKFGITLFGLFFMCLGLMFVGLIVKQTVRNINALSWEKTPCTITAGKVTTVSDGYAFEVEYAYRIKGKTFHSRQFKPGTKISTHDDVSKADALARRYAKGVHTFCFVNPDKPGEAVLARGSLWIGLIVLFPMIFVLVGGGVIYAAWTNSEKKPKTYSLSEKASKAKSGNFFLVMFFLVFFLAGSGFAYFMVLPELTKYLDADNWIKTSCVVQSSRVKSHDSDDGTTYSVDIVYKYVFNGRAFRSGKYKFIGGSSSGYSGKAAVVRRYPPGKETICYVNPKDPAEAVLIREMGPEALLALIPVLFMIVGLGGIIFVLKRKKRPGTYPAGKTSGSPVRIPAGGSRTILKPKTSAAGKIIISIAVASFWNGIVSIFVYQDYSGWRTGHPEYFLTLFLIPFVVIGLIMFGSIFYFIMAAFNPRPVITLATHIIHLGQAVAINWNTSGNVYKIRNFKLLLIGEETATYRRGTDTYTDRHTFYEKTLVESRDPEALRRGEAFLQVPATTMHSFKSDNNAVVWKINLHCDVPNWPDIKEDFEITVHPMLIGE